MFATFKGRRIKSREYRAFESQILKELTLLGIAVLRRQGMIPYRLEINLYAPDWFCKNGRPRQKDAPNMVKAFEDAICKALGWEDRYNFECVVRKAAGPEEKSEAIFTPLA